MRLLNKASVIFTLIDNYDKSSVNDSIIYCDKQVIPYVKKSNGMNVFLNLFPGEHNFVIRSKGFLPKIYNITTDKDSVQEIVVPLNYSRDNSKLSRNNKIVFRARYEGKMLRNDEVTIRLETKVPFMKVIEDVKQGSKQIKLNGDYNPVMLFQECAVTDKNLPLIITGYNRDTNSYTIRDESPAIPSGSLLKPVWHIRADRFGETILPVNRFFMPKNNLEFTLIYKGKEVQAKADISDDFYMNIEF